MTGYPANPGAQRACPVRRRNLSGARRREDFSSVSGNQAVAPESGEIFCRLSGLPLQAPALRVARDSSPRDCRPSVFSASLGAPLQRIILVTNGRPIGSAYVVEMSAAAFIAGRANGFAFFLVS